MTASKYTIKEEKIAFSSDQVKHIENMLSQLPFEQQLEGNMFPDEKEIVIQTKQIHKQHEKTVKPTPQPAIINSTPKPTQKPEPKDTKDLDSWLDGLLG